MTTRVKICGITRPEDATYCVECGVDAIGLVFYPKSKRFVEISKAQAITESLAPFITVVGLFMDADESEVGEVCRQVDLDLLQFHGQESAEYCASFDKPYIKAIAMGEQGQNIAASEFEFKQARGLLLDSHSLNSAGGSGESFDWSTVPEQRQKPLILAGGLNPDNVQSAIRVVRPYAVDCSSGVESDYGIKDHAKIKLFMENVADV